MGINMFQYLILCIKDLLTSVVTRCQHLICARLFECTMNGDINEWIVTLEID